MRRVQGWVLQRQRHWEPLVCANRCLQHPCSIVILAKVAESCPALPPHRPSRSMEHQTATVVVSWLRDFFNEWMAFR